MKPAATFEATDQLGEIVIDNPPLNLFSERLIADLRAAAQQAAASDARAVVLQRPAGGRRQPSALRSGPRHLRQPLKGSE